MKVTYFVVYWLVFNRTLSIDVLYYEGSKRVSCHSNWLNEQPLTAHYKKALSWFQVLLEVELLLRAWRKRTQHAFTAHLQREKDKVKWFTVAIWNPDFVVSTIWMMRAFGSVCRALARNLELCWVVKWKSVQKPLFPVFKLHFKFRAFHRTTFSIIWIMD